MTIAQLNRNAKAVNVITLFAECLNESNEYIADLNTSQLSKGKDSLNETLDPTLRSPMYAKMKKSDGGQAPLGVADLHNEGDFYEGFFSKADQEANLFISSTDSKAAKLSGIYGPDIFGLSKESITDLKSITLETLLIKLRNELFNS
jgi:hypothetical protein